MPVEVREEGRYERFETTKGNEILVPKGIDRPARRRETIERQLAE